MDAQHSRGGEGSAPELTPSQSQRLVGKRMAFACDGPHGHSLLYPLYYHTTTRLHHRPVVDVMVYTALQTHFGCVCISPRVISRVGPHSTM